MIITTRKDYETVKKFIASYGKNVTVVGCGSCAALSGTGGEPEVKAMVEQLKKDGFNVVTSMILDEVCDNRLVKKEFVKVKDQIDKSNVILSMACGVGGQSIVAMTPNKPLVVSNDTQFIGMTERIGRWYEKCRACGDCLLNETGGVCPIATCAKGLLNGPCGGVVDGKCEARKYQDPCGWIMIYKQLKAINKLDLFDKIRAPRAFTESGRQRSVLLR